VNIKLKRKVFSRTGSQEAGPRTTHSHLTHWSRTPPLPGKIWKGSGQPSIPISFCSRALLQAAHVILLLNHANSISYTRQVCSSRFWKREQDWYRRLTRPFPEGAMRETTCSPDILSHLPHQFHIYISFQQSSTYLLKHSL
jgi:hypothetical protein